MPNINLTTDECLAILTEQRFSQGGEAIICTTDKPNSLYKIFIDPTTGELVDMSDNKHRKVVALHQMKPKHSIETLSTISVNGRLVGYEMSLDELNIPLVYTRLNRQQTIEVLKRTKDALQYYDSKDITYGDVKADNILINKRTREVTFCDMDNIRLGQYPIDLIGIDLRQFLEKYGRIDGGTDAYMHNLLTLQQLGFPHTYTTYDGVRYTIEKGIYPDNFEERAKPIFESMKNPQNFNGEYIAQYIKR